MTPNMFCLLILLVCCYVASSLELDDEIVSLMPKIELHAHLHGSIRQSTLMELATASKLANLTNFNLSHLDLSQCFYLFSLVHKVIATKEVLKRVIVEVLEDYLAENTIYLELRSTPRSLPDGTTTIEYVRILVDMIEAHNIAYGETMLVKLILSIDRSKSFTEAQEVLSLAKDYQFYDKRSSSDNPIRTIVGLDFSGNPNGGRFDDFSPLFDQAKDDGLKITIHAAETKELSETVSAEYGEDETGYILSFKPDRIGHALFLLQYHIDMMIKLKHEGRAPPIEICPTSNYFTLGLQSYANHPQLKRLLSMGYPFSVNTDDRGIFDTSLTKELLHVKNAFGLSVETIVEIMASTVDQVFASEEEIALIKSRFWSNLNEMLESYAKEHRIGSLIASLQHNKESKARALLKQEQDKEVDLNTFITM